MGTVMGILLQYKGGDVMNCKVLFSCKEHSH